MASSGDPPTAIGAGGRRHGGLALPAAAALELDALRVHRDVDHAVRGSHRGEGEHEGAEPGCRANGGQGRREADKARLQAAAAAEPRHQKAAERQTQHRAALEPEHGGAELAGRQVEPRLDCRDAGRPRGEHRPAEEEDHHRRDAGPSQHEI